MEICRRNATRKEPALLRIIEKLLDHLDMPDLTEAHEVTYSVA